MRVGFYLENINVKDVDLSKPQNGNPGIGGTQYMICLISYYLQKTFEDLEIIIFANVVENLSNTFQCVKVESLEDAIKSQYNLDIFVFRAVPDKEVYRLIDQMKLKSVAWGHNFADILTLENINKSKYVKRYVAVGKQQYDLLRDHEVFNKATYIHNCISLFPYKEVAESAVNQNIKKDNIVCYVGSIVPGKGFDVLAQMWPKIRKKLPNAQLYVIGSGQLYKRDQKLGPYGIAEEYFESSFIHYLLNPQGNIDDSVHFFGVKGEKEKLEIMSKAKLGIINPTMKTETFGLSSIEFQALGVPVVTKRKFGALDTIIHNKTGFMYRTKRKKINAIVNLLKEDLTEYQTLCKQNVYENFDVEKIVYKWHKLFIDINSDEKVIPVYKSKYYLTDFKWLHELNRLFKKIPFLKQMPSILYYYYLLKKIVRL